MGVVAGIVGFSSSFTVVLAGLKGVGASDAQAASGLLALCVTMAAVAVTLSYRTRMPISVAWSTPGAALLATSGAVDGGFAAAVGAFLVCGVLLTAAGAIGALGRSIARIPVPIASAMLAGVLLQLCLAPVRAVVDLPALAAPVVLTWLLLFRFARLYAVPAALVAAVVVVLLDRPVHLEGGLLPHLELVAPRFSVGAVVGIALPLFIVTMASQNIPGMGVLATYGYRPELGPLLFGTGAGSVVAALFGGHAINLAAISAALVAGPDAGDDESSRWQAACSAGCLYLVIGLGATVAVAFVSAAPTILIEAVAGLALLGALGGALQSAMGSPAHREAATITLVTGASGITVGGIGPTFWGLAAGLAYLLVQSIGTGRQADAKRENAAS